MTIGRDLEAQRLEQLQADLRDRMLRDYEAYRAAAEAESNYERSERPPLEPFWSELQRMGDSEMVQFEGTPHDESSWYEREARNVEERERQRIAEQDADIDAAFLRELRNMDREPSGDIIVDYLGDHNNDLWGAWLRMGPKPYPRKYIKELAHKLWEQAGRPEGRSNEFWFAAEKALDKRGFAAAGVGGLCPTDAQMAYDTAIKQFLRRREYAIKQGQIDNSSLPAGYPMYFYCTHCGILLETLPEEYIFRPRRQCSQCKGLSEMRWLQDAKEAATEAGLPLPTPSKYHEVRKQGGETSGGE
jgi:hypothetical protein